ncbi:DUF1045 domain-containing protein [Peteryoungia desertarenae]|uniref:DUF1045 domain-containing protein n=1 Tax=Peteryoungia desertarenae TaxID=1813451 RepID=A0ABX6QKG0_9HYPH|nr:DUF1045 domain-containing protein [Peteryoungia desertarenae]QLF69033.1 DUF1045 domain-containing protein [Peteryoungia desertarenae]
MRYAVYFTPAADHPLTHSASAWLGRNVFTGDTSTLEKRDTFDAASLKTLTDDPRRYGFHATLKAPFELANDCAEVELVTAFEGFCKSHAAFDIPAIVVGQLGAFFALVPQAPSPKLQDFAASVVRAFEPFRAPLGEADIARRNPERLSESQRYNLFNFGYPYIFENFRFHMTLTGPVSGEQAPVMADVLQREFADHTGQPLSLNGLALCVEAERGAPFLVHSWQPLAA